MSEEKSGKTISYFLKVMQDYSAKGKELTPKDKIVASIQSALETALEWKVMLDYLESDVKDYFNTSVVGNEQITRGDQSARQRQYDIHSEKLNELYAPKISTERGAGELRLALDLLSKICETKDNYKGSSLEETVK